MGIDTSTVERLGYDGHLIWGHPKGLYYLAFTEAWERFSYYGMTALVVLYMVNQLLLPGHAEQVAGLTGLRAVLEAVFGPTSAQAFASQIFGLYSGFVYFTPLIGGAIADRWLGQRNAVIIGALLMAAGHVLMASDTTFLVALLLLILGSGFLKGNIAAQVGALYPRDNAAQRSRGFMIFSTGINVGGIAGPLLCGLVAQWYGWHYGFGIAAAFMLLGLATYLYGYGYLPAKVPRARREVSANFTADDRRVIFALITVTGVTMFQSVAYYQLYNVNPIWIQQYVSLRVVGFNIPVPWFQAFNALVSVTGVPLLFWIWRRQAKRGREPGDLGKIGVGAWMTAASNLILVIAIYASRSGRINVIWPFLYSAGLGISFLFYWPILLALISRLSPARVNATLVGAAYLSLFGANIWIGWIGSLYERIGPGPFWGMQTAIAACGGVIIAIFGRRLDYALRPVYSRI